jgi:hypothetical protein
MSEKELWLAPPEIETLENLKTKWFYNDPLYNLCIQLSYFNCSNEESYGAIALQKIDNIPTIIGIGWNMYMGGDTNLKRQGYANHAEFQSAALAESIGYNLNDPRKNTCIYVAGRFVKEDLLFFSPQAISFTCTTCTTNLPKYFKNTSLAAPTKSDGWRYIDMQEAYNSSLFFKYQEYKRREVINTIAKASELNIAFEQQHIDTLITIISERGMAIDERIKEKLLRNYENLLDLKPLERRKTLENLIDRRYKTIRKGQQASLYIKP